jgi:hypothetical protein
MTFAELVGLVDEEDTTASTVQFLLHLRFGLANIFASQV